VCRRAYRYAEELIRREQQQQQQQMMQDGWEERSRGGLAAGRNSHNSVTSSSSPDTTPPKKRRRATAETMPEDFRQPSTPSRDVTSVMTSRGHVVDGSVAAAIDGGGHKVLATQFACLCPQCRDSKPTYIVPLDFAQLQYRTTAQI